MRTAAELGAEVDRRDVGLEVGAVKLAHRGRVVHHDGDVATGGGRTGIGATHTLRAVLLELERTGMGGVRGHQGAGNRQAQRSKRERTDGCLEGTDGHLHRLLLLFVNASRDE